jgi:hypothetical protein
MNKIKTAGGSPTASHFFLLRQRKSNQKEGDPGLPPLLGGAQGRISGNPKPKNRVGNKLPTILK